MGQHETFTHTPTLYGTATNTHSARESYLQLHTLQHYGGQQETLTHTPILQGTARNTHTHSNTSGDSKKHSHTVTQCRGQQHTITRIPTLQGTTSRQYLGLGSQAGRQASIHATLVLYTAPTTYPYWPTIMQVTSYSLQY